MCESHRRARAAAVSRLYEDRLRAEGAEQRLRDIIGRLNSWGRAARNGGPEEPRAAWYFDVAQELREMFPPATPPTKETP
jgi:hypothetical protein